MRSSAHRHAGRRPGFTLVEILVSIAIIASLSAFAFSSARHLIVTSRIAHSTSNLRQLVVANQNYLLDHDTYCPADNQYNNRRWHGARTTSGGRFDPTLGFLSPYLGKSEQVSQCPLLEALVDDGESFSEGTGGYGYNAQYIGGRPGGQFDRTTKLRIPARPHEVPDPSNTVMFTTTAYALPDGVQEYATCEPPRWDYGNGNFGARPSPSVHFRANGKALVAWCDGRVTAEPPNDSKSGINPHGGDPSEHNLGWFGPEENNGYWNPEFRSPSSSPEDAY